MFSLKKNLAELTALNREKEKIQVLTTSLAFKQLVAISFLNEIFQEKSFLKKLIFLCSCEKEARKLSDFFSFSGVCPLPTKKPTQNITITIKLAVATTKYLLYKK